MKKAIILFFSFLMGLSVLNAETLTGRDIAQMAKDAQDTKSAATEVSMTLIEKNGSTSVRRLQMLAIKENDLTKTIMVFKAPASVENTRFLTHENKGRDDDQWIFLPALKKIKRIASGEKTSSFMGSDFSYADMENQEIDDYTHTLLKEETFDAYSCWIVQSVPKPETESNGYEKKISWIDKKTKLPIKIEYYEENSGELLKIMINSNIQQIDGYWTPLKMTMTTLASGHQTVMEVLQVKYDIPINPDYFTTNFLQTGRTK